MSCTVKISDVGKPQFSDLPSEMKVQIFENLAPEDRKNLASLGNELGELEQMAGHRLFTEVMFKTINRWILIRANNASDDRKNFDFGTPIMQIREFFKYGSTERLKVEGRLNEEAEKFLHTVVNSLQIYKIEFEIVDETSVRIFSQILRSQRSIEEMIIRWNYEGSNKAGKMLMELQPFNKNCDVTIITDEDFIDDDCFFHLVKLSSGNKTFNSPQSITGNQLTKIFEMICSGEVKSEVTIYGSSSILIHQFFSNMNRVQRCFRLFSQEEWSYEHRPSGAFLKFDHVMGDIWMVSMIPA